MDERESLFVHATALVVSFVAALLVKDLLAKISEAVVRFFSESFTTSIEVQCDDKTNVVKCLNFLIKQNCGGNLRHFGIARDALGRTLNRRYTLELDDLKDIKNHVDPLQHNKSIVFFYKRTLIGISRRVVPELERYHTPTEIYTLTAYGTRNQRMLIEMLDEARKELEKKPLKHINYSKFILDHGSFQVIRQFEPRALSTVVLKDGVTDDIRKDLEEFIESRDWYKERGIPNRRGYLLYGPPGCGKTSFIKAVAGQIGYDIFEVQLSNSHLTDEDLSSAMSSINKKAILLFEDVDAVFVPRVQDEANSEKSDGFFGKLKIREARGSLSFSGLLNAIDGAASEEDYIIFMTTNQIEKLDSALIRPGRIDMRLLIDYPDEQQIVAFFRKFYPDCAEGVAEKFAKAVTDLKCKPSVAQIQGIFLKHKHTPEDNLQDVDTLIEVCRSNNELGHIYL